MDADSLSAHKGRRRRQSGRPTLTGGAPTVVPASRLPKRADRHLADVRQFWAWVCAVHQLPNGWQTVKTGARSSAGGRRGTTVKPVDRTIVLSPHHVRELARFCAEGPFGPLAEVYVLLLGIAAGRPGESAGVHIADLDVGSGSSDEVRFKRTSRAASTRASWMRTMIRSGVR